LSDEITTVGHHVLVELYDCERATTDDPTVVRDALLGAAHAMGATPLAEAFHRFSPQGVSGVVLIAESHLSCHTWPEAGYVAVDIYTCGKIHPRAAVEHLTASFRARTHMVQDVVRGLIDFAPERPARTTSALFDLRAFHNPMRRVGGRVDTGVRRHVFATHGIVDATGVVTEETSRAVREEALRLLERFAERSVVRSGLIGEHGRLIRQLYTSRELLDPLEEIAGERLHPCPDPDEELLIAEHHGRGDTHGWRWGEYGHALIWILVAPPIENGGLLQCVPHTGLTRADSRVPEYLTEQPIHSYYFRAGNLYLLKTDTTLHRTIPLTEDTTRITLTMTWASDADLTRRLAGDAGKRG
jgi:S-adenosylmethionine decarboxylase proenzyme